MGAAVALPSQESELRGRESGPASERARERRRPTDRDRHSVHGLSISGGQEGKQQSEIEREEESRLLTPPRPHLEWRLSTKEFDRVQQSVCCCPTAKSCSQCDKREAFHPKDGRERGKRMERERFVIRPALLAYLGCKYYLQMP